MDHIHELVDAAWEKTTSRARKSNLRDRKSSHKVKECAGRTKRTVVKIPSGRPASATPSSPDPPSSTKKVTPQATPQIPKRKRSSPLRIPTSVPKGAEQSKAARPAPARPISTSYAPSTTATSVITSSPDLDDHLPIKKLRVQNSTRPVSHT